jgi:hypothetical protein
MRLFEETVRDEWSSSRNELKLQEKRLSQKLGELQKRKDLVTEAYFYENKIEGEIGTSESAHSGRPARIAPSARIQVLFRDRIGRDSQFRTKAHFEP